MSEPTTATHPLTPIEVAKRLRVHVNTVKRIPARELPYFRIGSRGDRRYMISDVDAYIKSKTER